MDIYINIYILYVYKSGFWDISFMGQYIVDDTIYIHVLYIVYLVDYIYILYTYNIGVS